MVRVGFLECGDPLHWPSLIFPFLHFPLRKRWNSGPKLPDLPCPCLILECSLLRSFISSDLSHLHTGCGKQVFSHFLEWIVLKSSFCSPASLTETVLSSCLSCFASHHFFKNHILQTLFNTLHWLCPCWLYWRRMAWNPSRCLLIWVQTMAACLFFFSSSTPQIVN